MSAAERSEAALRALGQLDEITRRLRRECPWDREQDERSIVPHTVEEAYELADAADSGDDEKLIDELGDVLFQVQFLALLLEERGAGSLEVVVEGLVAKLIRRHPHVFAEAETPENTAVNTAEVLARWDRIKREQEGRVRDGPFSDVPENLPGLLYARKLLRRAGSAGLPGPFETPDAALIAARRRLDSLQGLVAAGASGAPGSEPRARQAVAAELGELLLAVTDAARSLKCDPELAVRAAANRIAGR